VWAVGGNPGKLSVIVHYDGSAWAPAVGAPQTGGALFKVWGSAANDVFVVGQGATILHFDGAAWTKMDAGVPANTTLFTVAGRARDDVYAVGGLGVAYALHYDGQGWSKVAGLDLANASGLTGVAVSAGGDVAMSGFAGAKLRGHGGVWTDDSRLAPSDDLHAAWLDGPAEIFLVGGNYNTPPGIKRVGVIARYGP
jgi:hypothetical protein